MGNAHDPIFACAQSSFAASESSRLDSNGLRTTKCHVAIIVARRQKLRDSAALLNALWHINPRFGSPASTLMHKFPAEADKAANIPASAMHRDDGVRFWLKVPFLYNLFQTVIGGNALRRSFIDTHVRAKAGDKVIDIGCGPAQILPWLPDV